MYSSFMLSLFTFAFTAHYTEVKGSIKKMLKIDLLSLCHIWWVSLKRQKCGEFSRMPNRWKGGRKQNKKSNKKWSSLRREQLCAHDTDATRCLQLFRFVYRIDPFSKENIPALLGVLVEYLSDLLIVRLNKYQLRTHFWLESSFVNNRKFYKWTILWALVNSGYWWNSTHHINALVLNMCVCSMDF